MFQYSAITKYGLEALSGSIAEGDILKVTRIEYGDGIIEELTSATTSSAILEIIRNQTSLVNKKCNLSVYKIEKKENSDVRTIVGVIDPLSVVADFNAREAAIYAEYNGQEILFAYFTAVAFIDGEKTDTSNYISKIALSVKPCYFVTNISMANSTEIDYIFDADLSLPTITPIKIEGGYLLDIKDSLGVKTVEIKNRHLAGAGLKEEGDYLTAPVATQTTDGIMTAEDKTKLDEIEKGANNYTHPTTEGNMHIPVGGASGQILRWRASGIAEWGADNGIKSDSGYTYIIDSKEKLDDWAKNVSGNDYSHVLIKRGTWVCSFGGVNLGDTKTETVTGEKGSTIAFSVSGDGLFYNSESQTDYCKIYNVTVKSPNIYSSSFTRCWNLVQCFSINGSFTECEYLTNCIAYNFAQKGFYKCKQLSNCKALYYSSNYRNHVGGFHICEQVSTCYAYINAGTSTTKIDIAAGFYECKRITSCSAVVSATSDNAVSAFCDCNYMVNCKGSTIDCLNIVNQEK